MLGSVMNLSSWQWSAAGKHPAAKDYFQLGSDQPLMKTFFGWLRRGYGIIASREKRNPSFYSWRFWSRGIKKDFLVCGLIRDSGDGVGRPYPLLLFGHGPLKGWEDHWDLLVVACEKTWSRMEYLSQRVFNSLREFENEALRISSPESDWEKLKGEKERFWSSSPSDDQYLLNEEIIQSGLMETDTEESFFLDLNRVPVDDQFRLVRAYHFVIKRHLKPLPNAVFMGGTPERAYLAVYQRPLSSEDFVRLWSA